MLCGAVTMRGTPCQREGHIVLAEAVHLCWQHAADVERHYRRELGVYQLEHEIEELRDALHNASFDRADALAEMLEGGVTCDEPCVYIAESPLVPGLVKIGYTTRLAHRMAALNARALVAIPGTANDEALMHLRFRHLRWHREWFQRIGKLAELIDRST